MLSRLAALPVHGPGEDMYRGIREARPNAASHPITAGRVALNSSSQASCAPYALHAHYHESMGTIWLPAREHCADGVV